MTGINIRYEIKGLRFGQHGEREISVAIARGDAICCGQTYSYELKLSPIGNGEWNLEDLSWSRNPHTVLQKKEFVQSLAERTVRLLNTINMWPSEQNEKGARISINQYVILPEVDDRVIISFRPDILDVPSASWDHLWKHIERRAKFDEYFQVLGFGRETVIRVLPSLKIVFPNDWVRARYRAAGLRGMNDPFEPTEDGWFPAYHLARAAHGAVCRDPGWNYLVEIGLAIEALQGFEGLESLSRQLTRSPGTQHHICFAAELYARGLLHGLEPPTGTGSATNDLLVHQDGIEYQIELKEFASKKPTKRLQSELKDKVSKLPRTPTHPVIFHAVLIEDGVFDMEREKQFFQAVENLRCNLSEKIAAVVAGRRFVDSRGGHVKRDLAVVAVNPDAIFPIEEDALRKIFVANHERVDFPLYGIGSFMTFEKKPPEQEGANR